MGQSTGSPLKLGKSLPTTCRAAICWVLNIPVEFREIEGFDGSGRGGSHRIGELGGIGSGGHVGLDSLVLSILEDYVGSMHLVLFG